MPSRIISHCTTLHCLVLSYMIYCHAALELTFSHYTSCHCIISSIYPHHIYPLIPNLTSSHLTSHYTTLSSSLHILTLSHTLTPLSSRPPHTGFLRVWTRLAHRHSQWKQQEEMTLSTTCSPLLSLVWRHSHTRMQHRLQLRWTLSVKCGLHVSTITVFLLIFM